MDGALEPNFFLTAFSLPSGRQRLVGGTAVTETVFGWPGMGRLAVGAAFERDYPTITGIAIAVSAMVIVSNLLTDLCYVYLNPRIRLITVLAYNSLGDDLREALPS
jgi:ABC-type dipeptide/oligopeptide/nickel transport system permease component